MELTSEEIKAGIKSRIISEHRKYANTELDWAAIAANKIYAAFCGNATGIAAVSCDEGADTSG